MSGPAKPRKTSVAAGGKLTYRGVTLQKPATRSRFSVKEIKKAIEDAVAKNATVLAGHK
jgi:hypothetical protein